MNVHFHMAPMNSHVHALSTDPSPDPRVAEILERIKGVFAAKGFDGASMQDLARAAGMSAGNFYRYFPSKGAIIEAMVLSDLAGLEADFARIMQHASPREALRITIWRRLTEEVDEDRPLWAEIEAAAARRPEIAAIQATVNRAIRTYLLRIFSRVSGLTEDEATARFGTAADLLILLVRGAAMDACGHTKGNPPPNAAALHRAVMRHVDLILAEIAGETTIIPDLPPPVQTAFE
jgi:AcrR family transcriptional regulator